MCNFDVIKQMSISQNLYINVSVVIFTMIFLSLMAISLLNLLISNFAYKDVLNITDNFEYWELNSYIQNADFTYLSNSHIHRTIFLIFGNLKKNYEKDDMYFIENIPQYTNDFLVEMPAKGQKITNNEILNSIGITDAYPISFENYGNSGNSDVEAKAKEKKIIKHIFLFLHLIKKMNLLPTETENESSINKIFINSKKVKIKFFVNNNENHDLIFSPESKISEEIFLDNLEFKKNNLINSETFVPMNKLDMKIILSFDYVKIDKDKTQIKKLFGGNYVPKSLLMMNYFYEENNKIFMDEDKVIKNENISRKNFEDFLQESDYQMFFFSDFDVLNYISKQIFVDSEYFIYPIFFTSDENKFVKTKFICEKFIEDVWTKEINNTNSDSDSYLKKMEDCFANPDKEELAAYAKEEKTKVFDEYLKLSGKISELQNNTKFGFCQSQIISDSKSNDRYALIQENADGKRFCLNRVSQKKKVKFVDKFINKKLEKTFKFRNSILPLLSYDEYFRNETISDYYFAIFLRSEGSFENYRSEQYNIIWEDIMKRMFYFTFLIAVIILIIIYNIYKTKTDIDLPLKRITDSLNKISDSEFKDSKKDLDKYLNENDDNSINEFKYLIKMILKLADGNLNLNLDSNKFKQNEMEMSEINNLIQPINMVKFNRFLVFESKIMEIFDSNDYVIKLNEKTSKEIIYEFNLQNSLIFKHIIEKNLNEEKKKEKINSEKIFLSSEEKMRPKYTFPNFEIFKNKKNPEVELKDISLKELDSELENFELNFIDDNLRKFYKDDENEDLFNSYEKIFSEN